MACLHRSTWRGHLPGYIARHSFGEMHALPCCDLDLLTRLAAERAIRRYHRYGRHHPLSCQAKALFQRLRSTHALV